jgi:hypothetical protein
MERLGRREAQLHSFVIGRVRRPEVSESDCAIPKSFWGLSGSVLSIMGRSFMHLPHFLSQLLPRLYRCAAN